MGQTSPTLLDKVRHNDAAAWVRLVGLYSPLVYHWCKRAGLRRADAEEVGQDVFLAVARGLANFDSGPGGTFRGWLRVITRHKIIDHAAPPGGAGAGGSDHLRRLANVPAADTAADDDPDARAVEANILYRRAIELLDGCFEPKTRQAFWLTVAGRKAAEVAAELQLTPAAVYTAKSKVLRRLREEFDGLLAPDPPGRPPAAG